MISPPDSNGVRWANKCALCNSTRKIFTGDECSWCRTVRIKHGNYWYPINKTNAHLFPAMSETMTNQPQPTLDQAVLPKIEGVQD